MRRYETIVLVEADLSDELLTTISDKLKELVNQNKDAFVKIDDWGTKKLAYEINKRSSAHYIRYDFCTNEDIISKFEHFLKINDNVLKYMTILVDKKVNIDDIISTKQISEKEEETNTSESNEQEKSNGNEDKINS